MKLIQLSQIWIYPVKGLGGVPLTSASIQPKGLQYDRRWMLIDEKSEFMTQRVHPEMALFKLSMSPGNLEVTFRNETMRVPLDNDRGERILATVWDDMVSVQAPGAEYDNWFSERLGFACRLVQFPEENPRAVDDAYAIGDDHFALQDAFPFLLIGQASLDELNRRLPAPLPMNRFRPNFVFTGGDPNEEDTWQWFTIGGHRFFGAKRCTRCAVTTVNQDTGEKGKEPLQTLATYRQEGANIYFGKNLIGPGKGEVRIGDRIEISGSENIP
jgi:uncharacterized protein YcbX